MERGSPLGTLGRSSAELVRGKSPLGPLFNMRPSASGQARRFMQRQSSRSSLNGYESSTSAADIRDDGMDSPADLSPITPLFQRYSLPHSSQSFPCPLGSCVRPDPSLLSTRLVSD